MNKKRAISSAIVAFFYLALMCGVGLFGETAMWIVRLIAPYFFAAIGLVVVLFFPYRIQTALEKRKAIKEKIEEERRMAEAAARNKRMVSAAKKYDMDGMV